MTLEDKATELLREYAKSQGKSMRKIGILDERRMTLVNKREIPLSTMQKMMHKKGEKDG